MVTSCVIVATVGSGELGREGVGREVLSLVIGGLEARGIGMGRVRADRMGAAVECRVGGERVEVWAADLPVESEAEKMASLCIARARPWWGRVWAGRRGGVYVGAGVERLVREVDAVLAADGRFGQAEWVSHAEWFEWYFSKVGEDVLFEHMAKWPVRRKGLREVKNHAVLELARDKGMGDDEVVTGVLSCLAGRLEERGVRCGGVRRGCMCRGMRCTADGVRLSLAAYVLSQGPDGTRTVGVQCMRVPPWWKVMLGRRGHRRLCTGDALERLVEMVDGILAADGRFGDVRWLDRGEWERYVRAIWSGRLIRAVDRRRLRL